MRLRNSRKCRVCAEWREPIRMTFPKPAADQRKPAQDERAHQDLAQLGVPRHQRAQAFATQLEKLARLGDASEHQTALPGNHRHLAGEFARPVCGDWRVLRRSLGCTISMRPDKQHEKWNSRIVGLEQYFAGLDRSAIARSAGCDRSAQGLKQETPVYWRQERWARGWKPCFIFSPA